MPICRCCRQAKNKIKRKMAELSTIKDLASIVSPLTKSVVETFITPRLKELDKELSVRGTVLLNKISSRFNEYLERTYKKNAILNTLVFHNRQQLLQNLYLPLTINGEVKFTNMKKSEYKSVSYIVDDEFAEKFIKRFNKLLIIDSAGMGKSTIMKKLFLDIIDKKLGVPILIELRRLSKEKSILDEIFEQINPIDNEFNKDFITRLIRKGNFIFLFDGFDEISLSERKEVTTDIQNFIGKSEKNTFLITSRPESSLSSFGDFLKFHISSLKIKEAYELLRKYNNHGDLSERLIEKIKEKPFLSINEFLTNPFLVSLLYTAFEYKQKIPFKKHIFYRQVYDALFEAHDLSKGDSFIRQKHSNLDIDDFHQVLRYMGYFCLSKQKIEFTKDEILELISKANTFCQGLEFKESSFLKDIIKNVPIFTLDGIYYKWAHKSLQEYFAAQFIYLDSKDKKEKILKKLAGTSRIETYANLLDIYYGIDYKTFRTVLMKELLESYCNYYESSYHEIKKIDEEKIEKRKQIMFWREILFENKKEGVFNKLVSSLTGTKKHTYDYNISGYQSMKIERSDGFVCKIFRKSELFICTILIENKEPIFSNGTSSVWNNITLNDKGNTKELFDLFESIYMVNKRKITIDDRKDNLCNTPENFHTITNTISSFFPDQFLLDYKKCKSSLDEILFLEEKEKDDDFLIDEL